MDTLCDTPNCEFIHFGLLSLNPKAINRDEPFHETQHRNFDILGVGGASKVYRGMLLGEPVAIKMIWCVDITVNTIQQFKREVLILAQLSKHPNIIQVRGFSVMPPALCVVMELCNRGSLFDYLRQRRETGRLNLPTQLDLALQCTEAVAFLHAQSPPIVHKDIKSGNFLLIEDEDSGDLHVRLADLGSAIEIMSELSASSYSESSETSRPLVYTTVDRHSFVRSSSSFSEEWRGSEAITPNWAAPEVLVHGLTKPSCARPSWRYSEEFGELYTPSSDIYSLGVVLWEIMTLQEPFPNLTFAQIATRVGRQNCRLDLPLSIPPRVRSLISNMWLPAREERPTAKDIVLELQGTISEYATTSTDSCC